MQFGQILHGERGKKDAVGANVTPGWVWVFSISLRWAPGWTSMFPSWVCNGGSSIPHSTGKNSRLPESIMAANLGWKSTSWWTKRFKQEALMFLQATPIALLMLWSLRRPMRCCVRLCRGWRAKLCSAHASPKLHPSATSETHQQKEGGKLPW